MKTDFGFLSEPGTDTEADSRGSPLAERSFQSRPDILSRREAAVLLGICTVTLDRLDIPRTKIRHRIMYKRDVISKWVDDHTEKTRKAKA